LLGYNVWRYKYTALVLSGVYSGAAGAAYGVLFGYVGASFAAVAYSIFPLLWVLVGGVGTLLGPLVGTAFMVYLIDYASGLTDAYMLVVGVVLIFMVLFARRGFMGLVRRYALPWLP
jgi:branched-chain amino acid transport system permease protein